MTGKTREEKFTELCERMGIKYPFEEGDVGIYRLTFRRGGGEPFVVSGDSLNIGGRLYLQSFAAHRCKETGKYVAHATHMQYGDRFRAAAREFFSDVAHDTSSLRRRLLYGIFNSDSVEIEWKEGFFD